MKVVLKIVGSVKESMEAFYNMKRKHFINKIKLFWKICSKDVVLDII